jgi:eukaryotic-like serine/threonine-protein kinase
LNAKKVAWEFETNGSKANGPHLTNAEGTPKYQAAFFDDFYDDLVAGTERIWSVGAIFSSPLVDGDGRRCWKF